MTHDVWNDTWLVNYANMARTIFEHHNTNYNKFHMYTVRAVPNSDLIIVRTEHKSIPPNTHIHDRSFSGVSTGTAVKNGGAKLDLWVQISTLIEMIICKCFYMCLQWRSSQVPGRAMLLNGALRHNLHFNISAIKTSIMRSYYEGNNVLVSSFFYLL